MVEKVHDIYDVVLKLIVFVYSIDFLRYIGVEKNIEEVLKTEFTRREGKKLFLDFLCRVEDGTLCHIEFQFPAANDKDLSRFFEYNIMAQISFGSITDTIIVNFTSGKSGGIIKRIGKTKSFCPINFYLGDIDFESRFEKINKKVKSNIKLSSFDEIDLMLRCLVYGFDDRYNALKNVCEILKHEELFNQDRLDFFKSIIDLEIRNFLTDEEIKKLEGELNMDLEFWEKVDEVIDEVHRKQVYEAREEGIDEGLVEGRKQGIRCVAKSLLGIHSVEEVSDITGLSVDEVKSL